MATEEGKEPRFSLEQYERDPGPAIQHAARFGIARVFDDNGQLAAVVRIPVRERDN